jgi:hypothetical protein
MDLSGSGFGLQVAGLELFPETFSSRSHREVFRNEPKPTTHYPPEGEVSG